MHITQCYSILSTKLSIITLGLLFVLLILCNKSMPEPNVVSNSSKKFLQLFRAIPKHRDTRSWDEFGVVPVHVWLALWVLDICSWDLLKTPTWAKESGLYELAHWSCSMGSRVQQVNTSIHIIKNFYLLFLVSGLSTNLSVRYNLITPFLKWQFGL